MNAFILVIKQLKLYNLCAHMKHYFAHKLIIADLQKHLIKHSKTFNELISIMYLKDLLHMIFQFNFQLDSLSIQNKTLKDHRSCQQELMF